MKRCLLWLGLITLTAVAQLWVKGPRWQSSERFPVTLCRFGSDGKFVMASSIEGPKLLLDPVTTKVETAPELYGFGKTGLFQGFVRRSTCSCIPFACRSGDGRWLLEWPEKTSYDHLFIRLIDISQAEEREIPLNCADEGGEGMGLSHFGDYLAVSFESQTPFLLRSRPPWKSTQGTVIVFHLPSQREIARFVGSAGLVSPDGRYAAIFSNAGHIELWDLARLYPARRWVGLFLAILGVAGIVRGASKWRLRSRQSARAEK